MRVHPEYLECAAAAAAPEGPRRSVGGALRVDRRGRAALGAQRLRDPQVLPQRVAEGAAQAVPRSHRRARRTTGSSSAGDFEETQALGRLPWTPTRTRCARRASRGRRGTAIPADSKCYMRRAVAEIIVDTLERARPALSRGHRRAEGRDGERRSARCRPRTPNGSVTAGGEVDALLLARLAGLDQDPAAGSAARPPR